jgi:hypothetical protein
MTIGIPGMMGSSVPMIPTPIKVKPPTVRAVRIAAGDPALRPP